MAKDTILENRNKGFRAGAVIIKDNKILLMHQIVNGEDFYTLPGGSWELGETLEQTCKREIKEECNIDIQVGKLLFLIDTSSRISFYFECINFEGEPELGGPEKDRMHENEQYYIEWKSLESIKNLVWIPRVARDALINYLGNINQSTFFVSESK